MNKDYNEIAKYEKAIKDKYGEEAIQNPKKDWTQEKEIAYLEDLKAFHAHHERGKRMEAAEGFTIKERITAGNSVRDCPVCASYSFSTKDDLYMNKFECCFDCYIQYVEGREERWKSGWRPNK
jgi:hypothetical protein